MLTMCFIKFSHLISANNYSVIHIIGSEHYYACYKLVIRLSRYKY